MTNTDSICRILEKQNEKIRNLEEALRMQNREIKEQTNVLNRIANALEKLTESSAETELRKEFK